MILVLGSGFGLYGHLAALAQMDQHVAAPARYRQILLDRVETAALEPQIDWVDEHRAIGTASHIVLARRPLDNFAMAGALADARYSGALVIEKPMAPTPAQSLLLGDRLTAAGIDFAVPYLFLHCPWTQQVRSALARNSGLVRIDWAFRQSPSVLEWKRTATEGGGNLAYYFIHCIALAEGLLPGARYRWSYAAGPSAQEAITLTAERGNTTFVIAFDQMAEDTYFKIGIDGETVLVEDTPFGAVPQRGVADPRIPVLQHFYRKEVFATPLGPHFHSAIAMLWDELTRYIATV